MVQSRVMPLRLGLIGCGRFGEFCLESYWKLPGLRLTAVADHSKIVADRVGKRFSLAAQYDADELLKREDVDLVHIATQPSTHHELAMRAIAAGKHVLCEKPLALSVAQADEMLDAAATQGVIVPVNFVLRYSPVTDAVRSIITSGVLGKPLHAVFENFAQDETLGPHHWFWDRQISGGIFVEHAVHFFDLYSSWFGKGKVVAAHVEYRTDEDLPEIPHGPAQDRVMCISHYENGAAVYQYHGFNQPIRMDRQLHHIQFELGEIFVHGWLPQSLELMGLVDDAGLDELERLLPGSKPKVLETYKTEDDQHFNSHWRRRKATQRVSMAWDPGVPKEQLYHQCISDLMQDQLEFLGDRRHLRRIEEKNGREAVVMAEMAKELSGG